MSNPDLPEPYWQDQGVRGYGSGWRGGADVPSRQQSAWDDGSGFWRDDRSQGSAGRDSRPSRHRAPQYPDRQSPARSARRSAAGAAAGASDAQWPQALAGRSRREPQLDDDWGSHRGSGRSAGRARRSADSDREDWTGRLSQTAGDLRSKLGNMRTRAAASLGGAAAGIGMGGSGALNNGRGAGRRGLSGSANDDYWAEQSTRQAGPGRGARRGAHAGGYGDGGYGPGDYGNGGYDGRTAPHDPAGDFWSEPDRTSRGVGFRTAQRQFAHGGGHGRGGGGRYGGGPGGGGGFKNWLLYGSWWRHWTLKKALAVVGGGIAACFLLGIGAFFIMYKMTPIPTASELTANWQSSTVYFADGKQMGTFDSNVGGVTIDRMLLTPAQIPQQMTHAMTAAEDRHFYTEGGVSVTGLMRATYEDVFGSGNLQGGSTITMQYAKNYYSGVNSGQNLSTKLKEIFIAMKLGHDKSKQWVMTNYLNTVPFGATIDGLGAAAESYFNVNLTQPGAQLTLAQEALLAAMPNNPAVFGSVMLSPKPQAAPAYQQLYDRFEYVLGNMVRDGTITAAQAKATKFPTSKLPPSGNGWTGYTGYLMNMVLQQMEAPAAYGGYGLTQQQVDTGGYKIKTTFIMSKVKALAQAIQQEKARIKANSAYGGVPFRNYDRIGAVLENSKTGAIVAIYGGPGYLSNQKRCNASDCQLNQAESAEPVGSSFKPYVLSDAVNQGMSVFSSKLNGYSPIWIPTGSSSGQSDALKLSPTSKPPGCPTAIPNVTKGTCYSTNGTRYFLFNESSENYGPLQVNAAAAVSSDSAFEDLAHRDGIESVIKMAEAFGVGQNAFVEPCGASSGASTMEATLQACNDLTGPGFKSGGQWYPGHGLESNFSPNSRDKGGIAAGTRGSPAVALGENPLTPIEQASTFATLANHGFYNSPHVISSVQQGATKLASPVKHRQVLSPNAAADVDWALSFDNNFSQGGRVGTAQANVTFRRGDVIGKTGTLGTGANASQAWFIGATPEQYALSVALFTNEPGKQVLNNLPSIGGMPGSQGGGWPASIWNQYMQTYENGEPLNQLFPQVQAGFVPWKRVPQVQHFCGGFGGFGGGNQNFGGQGGGNQQCVCPKHAQFCGNNTNPQPGCHGNGNCGGGPAPSPSCGFGGILCGTTSPPTITPSPSVTPSGSPSPSCSGAPGHCTGVQTTSFLRSSPGSGSSPGSAASMVMLAAEDTAARLAPLLGLVI